MYPRLENRYTQSLHRHARQDYRAHLLRPLIGYAAHTFTATFDVALEMGCPNCGISRYGKVVEDSQRWSRRGRIQAKLREQQKRLLDREWGRSLSATTRGSVVQLGEGRQEGRVCWYVQQGGATTRPSEIPNCEKPCRKRSEQRLCCVITDCKDERFLESDRLGCAESFDLLSWLICFWRIILQPLRRTE